MGGPTHFFYQNGRLNQNLVCTNVRWKPNIRKFLVSRKRGIYLPSYVTFSMKRFFLTSVYSTIMTFSNQVRHKLSCTTTEECQMLEFSDLCNTYVAKTNRADPLRDHRTDDLCLCFRICRLAVSNKSYLM